MSKSSAHFVVKWEILLSFEIKFRFLTIAFQALFSASLKLNFKVQKYFWAFSKRLFLLCFLLWAELKWSTPGWQRSKSARFLQKQIIWKHFVSTKTIRNPKAGLPAMEGRWSVSRPKTIWWYGNEHLFKKRWSSDNRQIELRDTVGKPFFDFCLATTRRSSGCSSAESIGKAFSPKGWW